MNCPVELKYTKSHEWVKYTDDSKVLVGLTDYAQAELGDLVYVNLPEIGDTVTKEDVFADVESVKAVSDVYAPITGSVTKINEELLDAPESINESPYEAWFVEVEGISDDEDLMSAEEYEAFINECEE